MDVLPHRNVSDCRSSSSNHYLSGQRPKISIGVRVETSSKLRSETRKEDETARPSMKFPFQGKIVEENRKLGSVMTLKENQTEVQDRNAISTFSMRSLHQETRTANKAVQFYANQTSILQSENGVHKKLNSVTYEKREKGYGIERLEGVAFATMKETHMPDIGAGIDNPTTMVKDGKEALKSKLWEILGSAPAQEEKIIHSPTLEVNEKPVEPKQNDFQRSEAAKAKQNSDTIETDSDPNQPLKRPVTRSYARQRAPNRKANKHPGKIANGRNPIPNSNSDSKLKSQQESIFAFNEAEVRAENRSWAINDRTSGDRRKNSGRKSTVIEPRCISFPKMLDSDRRKSNSDKRPFSGKTGEASVPHFNEVTDSGNKEETSSPPMAKETVHQEVLISQPPGKHAEREKKFESASLPNNPGAHDQLKSRALETNTDPVDDLQSPTFAVKSPPENDPSSPQSPRSNLIKKGFLRHKTADKRVNIEDGFCRLRNFQDMQKGSPVEEDKDADEDSESSEDAELIRKGFRKTEWFTEMESPDKSPVSCHRKRFCGVNKIRIDEHKSPSPFAMGAEEDNVSEEASGQIPDNGLSRSVSQLAKVLQRFSNNVHLHTNKKTSEILLSLVEKSCLQLENVESHIQADLGKFTSTGKTKRKRLEAEFQEQQERLKLIHDKFREEVNQHLQVCRKTIEELEAHQMELKGTADRQRASHRKLIMEVEGSIGAQLNDAQRSITVVQKAARKKMHGLKLVLEEFLGDLS
ncbi:hypothetical protein QJS10_CPB04g01135 [Acorus calamus]|uniref:Meiosis-specific protein ASY3-like coiled-coil domain-containing protein n=1 Tax=Acorus calamus TaxID=4465 RepID=A0AAV9F4E2_ACOCL|nr:hypothetical protein QJS10_CPB04g01135 [Acorus calamus]